MANSFVVSRTQLIYALCLPLAVLMGYFLAEPMDSGAVLLVTCVLGVLSVPILMRWHHPLLVFSWNAAIYPAFLPGRPQLWALMAFASLFFALLARSTSAEKKLLPVPTVTRPLLFLALVIIGTICLTGGIGLRSFGSDRYGGKNYVYLLMAICGYFALTSERIPPHRAPLYVGLFFLSGLTALVSHIAYYGGNALSFLYWVFPADFAIEQARSEMTLNPDMIRLSSLPLAAVAVYSFMLSRSGIQGILDFSRPWRVLLLGAAGVACMLSGFRSSVVLLLLILAALFWLEKLWKTRWLPMMALGLVCATTFLVCFATKLPLTVQRSLAFLPLQISPIARENAMESSQWRIDMWRRLLPDLPKYLIKGKGYAMDPDEMFMAQFNALRAFDSGATGSAMAGDYHNGPLTVYIPFGTFGVIAFGWFLVAGGRLLWFNYKNGEAALRNTNRFLLAAFIGKLIFFLAVFGSFQLDLMAFTGLVGLSVSLNGGCAKPVEEQGIEDELESEPALLETSFERH